MCYGNYKYPISKKPKSLKIRFFKYAQISSNNQRKYFVFINSSLKTYYMQKIILGVYYQVEFYIIFSDLFLMMFSTW